MRGARAEARPMPTSCTGLAQVRCSRGPSHGMRMAAPRCSRTLEATGASFASSSEEPERSSSDRIGEAGGDSTAVGITAVDIAAVG